MSFRSRIGGMLMMCAMVCGVATAQDSATERASAIRALGTTLRVLQITAHPGDEDGALLMQQARGLGAEVTLLTLTRGERQDNLHSILSPTSQGLLRTIEQLASDRQYGVEQRFTRVVDFGYARSANEVFDRWAGHNTALADMVQVIRETRPDVIVTPFDPDEPDGDGQHEATAILAREAFRAASDAKKFPEQLKDGVEVWQAKRLFALTRARAYAVYFHAAGAGPGMHEGWQPLADRALAEQHSQGTLVHAPRSAVRHYRLLEAAPGFRMPEGAGEFAEGIATGLERLVSDPNDSRMQARVQAMNAAVSSAIEQSGDRVACVEQLAEYLRNLQWLEDRAAAENWSRRLRDELVTKRRQAEQALARVADIRVRARLMEEGGGSYVVYPGASYAVELKVEGAGAAGARVVGFELRPEGGRWTPRREWNAGDERAVFRGRVPMDAPYTRPQLVLENDFDGVYRVLDEHKATAALPAAALVGVADLEIEGIRIAASAPVMAEERAKGADGPLEQQVVMVAPPISVIVEPRTHWNRRTNFSYSEIQVRVRNNMGALQNAMVSVHAPQDWRAEPEHEVLDIAGRGEEHSYRFFLIQDRRGEESTAVRAVVRWGGAVFDQGYTVVRGPDEQVAFDYRASVGSLISAKVEMPEGISVGYVGVEGDQIPAALRDVGIRVTNLDRAELANGRLGKYWAIVVGRHAVDDRDDVGEQRGRLLKYAEEGGVIVVMEQADRERFSRLAPMPYALEIGDARVSNEASAVEIVEPHGDPMWDPNEITSADFRGWSEERGRHFAQKWDRRFEVLLRMRDAGQPVQEGSLLRTRYGRGSVVYTGLSFEQQLTNGAPGAMRLLVNLLSSSAELHR